MQGRHTDLAAAGGCSEARVVPVVASHRHQPRDYLMVQLDREHGHQHRRGRASRERERESLLIFGW